MELIAFLTGVSIGILVMIAVYYVFVKPTVERRLKARADSISERQRDLTALYNELADKMDLDPARLGIDVGKEYAVNRVQNVLNEVREELQP